MLQPGVAPGSYDLRADCINTLGGGGSNYATIPFTVTLPTFTASATSAPVGVPVTVQSVDPCVGGDDVYLRLLDASGAHAFQPTLDVNADGSWGGTIVLQPGVPGQPGVTPGPYELRADCNHSGGGSSNYATIPFTVTLARFTASATSASVGVPVTVQSVDPCVGGDEVYLRLLDASGAPGTFLPFLDVNADGSWGGTIVLQPGVPGQPGVIPGSYELRADCNLNGGGSANYTPIPFTVTSARFTASATSAPVGVPVTVQSVDPCVGGDEVYLRLLDASGAPGALPTVSRCRCGRLLGRHHRAPARCRSRLLRAPRRLRQRQRRQSATTQRSLSPSRWHASRRARRASSSPSWEK